MQRLYKRPLILLPFILLLFVSCGPDRQQVKALTKKLRSADASERNSAAMDLAGASKHADLAVPALIKALSDRNGGVQSSAAYALRKLDTPEARQALEQAVKD